MRPLIDVDTNALPETLPTSPLPTVLPGDEPAPTVTRMSAAARRWRKLPRWRRVLALVVVLPLVTCIGGLLVYVVIPPPPVDILVLGVDARPGEGYVTRTDTVMLLGVQPRRLRVNLLSIPRDLFINVPGYGSQRINTVNMLGEIQAAGYGPELLSAGIEASFGITPDRYARVNFDAFVQLVDAVGGVTVDVPKRIVDYQYPTANYSTITVTFEPGKQHMDGETALIYARTRHADDDYGRAARQQQVLSALTRKLANPLNWVPAGYVISQNVDTNIGILDMVGYAPPVLVGGGYTNRLVIDRDHIKPGASGAIPDYDKLAPWLAPRFD